MAYTDKKEIKAEAEYIMMLAKRIYAAACEYERNTLSSGTINNLAPEIAKTASKLRRMARWQE